MHRNTVHWRHYIRKMLHIYKSYKGMITWDAMIMKCKTKQKYHTVATIPKYHTVATIPKSNIEVVERGKIDTPPPPHLCLVQRTLITQHKQIKDVHPVFFVRSELIIFLISVSCFFVRLRSASCTLYFLCLWIVHSWLPLGFLSRCICTRKCVF